MTFQAMCSRCGHRSRKYKCGDTGAEQLVKAGWNSFGGSFYCRKCCATWEERNGKDRPLWGPLYTEILFLDRQATSMAREVERLEKRLKKCRKEMGFDYDFMDWGDEY